MTPKKPAGSAARTTNEVDNFMAKLRYPLKADLEVVRKIILGASPAIGEAIKWNAPSFRTTEFFATANLRSLDRVQFIFHLGAKVRGEHRQVRISDPDGMIKWLAKDRCVVTMGAGQDIPARRAALEDIVRQWVRYV
jgi:hypothetical protein